MYLKTHFKFLFNSYKNYTIRADVIFFLDARLHSDPNKIGLTQIGSTKLEIQFFYKIHSKTEQMSYPTGSESLTVETHTSATRK